MRVMTTAAAIAAGLAATTAAAQTAPLESRVGRLESEMRAVQRKVFPGGAGMTVEPQIAPQQAPADVPGAPSSSAVADLTQRVSALEASVRSVTGEVEQAGYRIRQLEQAFEAYRKATDARLTALEGGAPAPAAGEGAGLGGPAVPSSVAPARPAESAGVADDPARAQALAAVPRPTGGDPAEDGYLYGFRLWQAKLYPEAAKELKAVADQYPRHRRASFAQNLLGRAYLDDGKPSLASMAFYDSYKKYPDGERAPDSLFYLGQALVKLKKPADACKVYTELSDVYGDKLSAGMKADLVKNRAAAKCQ